MPLNRDQLNVIVRYQDQVDRVRGRVIELIRRQWGSLDSWRDKDIDRFVARVVPVVAGGQAQTASLTDAYLATIESSMTGLPVRPIGVRPESVTTQAVRGVPAAEVYARTGPTVWRALQNNKPLTLAVAAGLARAVDMASTDLQLAKTHTARQVFSRKDNVTGYRRVLSPSACSLCQGSTHPFGKDELMPIHPGCTCGSVPIFRGDDPGEPATDTSDGEDKGTPTVRQHGEIGPMLADSADDFTGPDDL